MVKTIKITMFAYDKRDIEKIDNILKQTGKIANTVQNAIYKLYILQQAKAEENEEKFKFSMAMNFAYQATSVFDFIPSDFRLGICTMVRQKFNNDIKDAMSGDKVIANYRSDIPAYFASGNTTKNKNFLKMDGTNYMLSIGGIWFVTHLGRDKSNNRAWFEKIKAGEVKFCDSSFYKNKGKNKGYTLCMAVKFESDKRVNLSKDNVLGVDMGIAVPLMLGTNNSSARLEIGASDLIQQRLSFRNRRQAMQKDLRYEKGGHGRKAKLQKLDRISRAEHNYVDTLYHQFSKRVIDFALQNDCGIIKMEDLTGIRNVSNVLADSWGYFDLQQKISYKAEQAGIMVVKVDPKHTSQMCSCCGHIDKENRKTQSEFLCTKCGHKDNADYNAAVNIARSEVVGKRGKSKKQKEQARAFLELQSVQ